MPRRSPGVGLNAASATFGIAVMSDLSDNDQGLAGSRIFNPG